MNVAVKCNKLVIVLKTLCYYLFIEVIEAYDPEISTIKANDNFIN